LQKFTHTKRPDANIETQRHQRIKLVLVDPRTPQFIVHCPLILFQIPPKQFLCLIQSDGGFTHNGWLRIIGSVVSACGIY
jgi:hypothetical protein